MQVRFTKAELIDRYIKANPADPYYEDHALAGYVRLKDGRYTDWDEYVCMVAKRREDADSEKRKRFE